MEIRTLENGRMTYGGTAPYTIVKGTRSKPIQKENLGKHALEG